MKIFNWLNRKLNHKAEELAQDGYRIGLISDQSSDDTRDVMGSDSFSSVFDGWKGGILAVGTFGYEALRGEDEHDQEYCCIQQEPPTDLQEEGGENDEEVNLLVNAARLSHVYKGFMEMETDHDGDDSPKQERTTLAQLFSADSKEKERRGNYGEWEIVRENSAYHKKHVNEDAAPPIHKLHRVSLLRRLLEKKVHPDFNRNTKTTVQPYD